MLTRVDRNIPPPRQEIDPKEAYEIWLTMEEGRTDFRSRPVERLRTLQKLIERKHGRRVDLRVLERWHLEHQWDRRALDSDIAIDRRANELTAETLAEEIAKQRILHRDRLTRSLKRAMDITGKMLERLEIQVNEAEGQPVTIDEISKLTLVAERLDRMNGRAPLPQLPSDEEGQEDILAQNISVEDLIKRLGHIARRDRFENIIDITPETNG